MVGAVSETWFLVVQGIGGLRFGLDFRVYGFRIRVRGTE